MRDAAHDMLLLGATGAIGRHVVRRLAHATPPVRVLALSRRDPPPELVVAEHVAWRRGDLDRDAIADPVATIVSAGPLD
ncbi:MAG TPA: NAD-dependent epimerase/dehydratase family protein, partial [Xanthomonadales bacterium]|nr:NAD-dependent epimerase/dehydratase family protein [Xanthomonadales bacterium]